MSYDRRKVEADIGVLLHAYIQPRSASHPESPACHVCIGMAAGLIEDAHEVADTGLLVVLDEGLES